MSEDQQMIAMITTSYLKILELKLYDTLCISQASKENSTLEVYRNEDFSLVKTFNQQLNCVRKSPYWYDQTTNKVFLLTSDLDLKEIGKLNLPNGLQIINIPKVTNNTFLVCAANNKMTDQHLLMYDIHKLTLYNQFPFNY